MSPSKTKSLNVKVDDFLRILKTVNRFTTDIIVQTKGTSIYSTVVMPGGSAIIHVESDIPVDVGEQKMNLQGVNRLVSVLTGIPKGTDMLLKVTSNAILHNANGYKFKFHMLDDGIITEAKVTPDQIKNLKADQYVSIDSQILSQILKSSAFIRSEKVKCYFEVEDGKLLCTLTDKAIANTDEFSVTLSEEFADIDLGSSYICDIEYLRQITYAKDSTIQIGFASNSMHFEIAHENGISKYIFSMLTE